MKAKLKVLVQLMLYIITVGYSSADAIGQSETKDYITYDTLYKIGYGGYEYRLRITRPRNMFTPGHADAAERPAIITMPGQGEMGTDYAKLRSYGPHYWLNRKSNGTIDSTAGWDGGIQLANGTHYPIYITMIASTTWPGAKENYQVLNYLLNTYHIKRNSVHLGGLSQGAMTWSSMILYEESAGAESGMSKVTSLVCLQGLSEELFQPALSWSRGPAGWGHWAKKYKGKFLGLEGTNDFRQIWACSRPMNDSVPGSAYFAYETFGNGGHCCWNSMYDPFRTNWTNTGTLAPNITTGAYANTPGTYYAPSSIFQWMLRQGDTALVAAQGTANIPPVAKAGSDVSITLPLASVTLNGSGSYDPDGTITSYSWQKISGPLTLNILDLNSVTTLVTGLLAGTYQFELTVKDDKNAVAKDTVSVNVSLLPNPTPDPPGNTFQWPTGNVRIWKVGPSEYKVGYLYTDGTLWSFNHLTGKIKYNFNGKRVKDVASCDFSRLAAVDEDGYVWMTKLGGGDDGDRIEVDTTGAPFDKNIAIAGHYQTNVTIREDGSLWYFGSDWYNLYAGTAIIKRPIQLSPAGMKVKKVVMGHRIVVLTESGEVWDWVKDGSRTPTKKNLPGPAFTIFTSQNDASGCLVPETAGSSMGYPYVWGAGNALWGGTVQYSTPTPLKSFWNLTMPLKEISANDQTIHYIDSLGRLFGVGDNSQGNIGSGIEKVNQWDYASQYAWSFIFGELLTGNPPVEVSPGVKFKKIYKNNTLGYFSYFQDERDSIYFVGRDKSLVGGRGWKNFDDALYANAWDVVKPLMVSPRYANFQQYTFAKGSANAGSDRAVQASSVTLSGSGTPTKFSYMGNLVNGLPSITYPISGYKWTKVSGGTATITEPNKAVTTVTGLQTGDYVFRLVTTDTNSATFMDEVKITVNLATNQPPVSNAGPDINITLPTNSATLAGSGTDADGTITSYNWKYIDGPTQYAIGTPNAAQTQITNLVQGVYHFELIVTDNNGLTGSDIVTVNVTQAAPPNQPPVANAGGNKTITLPTNTVSLTGSGTDADGTISSYAWTILDGPAQYTIASPAAAQTNINNLVQGIYRFQLRVTDDKGASSTDIVTVTVNAAPPPANEAPLAEAGANKTITLPVQAVTLQGSGTDNDGTIVSYAWKQLSGPSQSNILTPAAANTVVNGLVAGIYHFELTVTDDDGATATDEVTVTVNSQPPANQAPVVNAGANQVITLPVSQVTVTGTASDPDGSIATYQWSWVSGPTQYTIASPGTAQTLISGLVQGVYRFQLRVTDNNGASATSIVQITVNPAVVPPNQLPTVDAGANIVITLPTNTANLSGTAADPDGSISTYAWTLVSGPAGAVIASPATAQTAVNGLVQGVYYFELKVTDNRGGTATDVVTVTVNAAPPPPNQLPVAEAGQNISITLPTNSTTLTGSGTDADGTIVSYQWTYFDGPTQYTIVSPNAAQTVINNLVVGVYRFQLRVTDNRGGTATDFVTITVNPKPNAAPTANAGNDIAIVLPVNFAVITGSGTDGDGTIASYLWTKVAGPGQFTIETPNAAQTRFSNLVAGTYTFQLEVKDNQGASGTDQVNIVVHPSNQLPVANAGVDVTITLPTSSLTISGVNSYDPDGNIVTYSWNKISGPTSYIMVTPNKSQTLVTTLVQGVYSFELTVIDNLGGISKDTVKVTVNPGANPPQNQLPVVNAGNDIILTLPQNSTQLFGGASDPDGTIASYQWTKVSGPASYTLSAAGSAQTEVSNLVAGVYVFELTAVDNAGGSSKDAVIITVNPAAGNTNNNAPVADAGDDIQIKLPLSSVTLNGSGTDADGWITGYKWRKIEGPQLGDIVADDHASTVISNLTQGVYRFELTVTDDKGAIGKDTVEVKVTGDESRAGVYPNPVTDVLNVRIDAITQKNKTTIRIFDVKGVLVHREEFMRDFPSIVHQVNVSRLMKGAYFITIGVDINVTKTIQFIKQ